jgi:two-component system phosphate regulon sensor histidine kinase PhoR
LLVNGMKYTLAEGTVRMRWWTDAEGAYFSGDRQRHRHSRGAHPAADRALLPRRCGALADQGGSGLGLAIVKHALQRHGGWLDVQSTEGKGSTFTCHFPSQRMLPAYAARGGERLSVTICDRNC